MEQGKDLLKLPHSIWHLAPIKELGETCVTFFFALSGFLITYLLIAEKEKTGTVRVGQFYLRRILRIWPVYYAVVLVVFGIIPRIGLFESSGISALILDGYWPKLALFLVMFPHLAYLLYPPVPGAVQAWSIGVEEQFYLMWPVFFKSNLSYRKIVLGVLVLLISLKTGLWLLQQGFPTLGGVNFSLKYLYLFRIQCMAMGGLFAYGVFFHAEKLRQVLTTPIRYLMWGVTGILVASGINLGFYHHEVLALLFGGIITLVALFPEKMRISFEFPAWNFLGKISYGLYMYHQLCLGIVLSLLAGLGFGGNAVLGYLASFGLTLLVSTGSYFLMEKPFLRFKTKLAVVESGG